MPTWRALGRLQAANASLRAHVRSSARSISAAVSTALVGTWSTRGAAFDTVPRELRTADPTRASQIVEGYIALGGKTEKLDGRKLFDINPPSEAFAKALHSFEWLRHLRAYEPDANTLASRAVASRVAREHTLNWLHLQRKHPSHAFTPLMAARRSLSLTNQAAFVFDGASAQDYETIMAIILRDTRRAFTHRAQVQDPTDHCFLVTACASVAHALSQHIGTKSMTMEALSAVLPKTFHSDGGPKTRCPADLALLLPTLLSLQALLTVRRSPQPPQLGRSINQSMTMLRQLRHPDGTVARFHGTTSLLAYESDLVATVLTYDTQRKDLPILAPDSGFGRLQAGPSLVLMDCGSAPPASAARQAHAGALAFEWSVGTTKIITNSAEIGYSVDADLWEQRTTRAQSTLVAAGLSSALLSSREPDAFLQGGLNVSVAPPPTDTSLRLSAQHSGYRQRLGVDHARSLQLADDGSTLEGDDRLLLASGEMAQNGRTPYALYFQLQPGAQITREGDQSVQIKVRGQTVRFEADTGHIAIEDPTNRPTYRGAARALRMVVHSPSTGPAQIKWRFSVQ
jgi:uncharacterized heparinase superfamily protein